MRCCRCGPGGGILALLEMVPSTEVFTAVELVEGSLEVARERFGHLPAVDLVQGDITDMNTLPDGGYDIVFDEVILSHFRGKHMPLAVKGTAELQRVMAPNGVMVLSGWVPQWELNTMVEAITSTGMTEVIREDLSASVGEGCKASCVHIVGSAGIRRLVPIADVMLEKDLDIEQLNGLLDGTSLVRALQDSDRCDSIVQQLKLMEKNTDDETNFGTAVEAPTEERKPAYTNEEFERYGKAIDCAIWDNFEQIKRVNKCDNKTDSKGRLKKKRLWVIVLKRANEA